MICRLLFISAACLAGLGFGAATAETPGVVMPEKHYSFFENYCLDCHDADTEKGSVNLEDLSFDLGTLESAEMWQKVLNSLNSGEMPPEKKKQPEDGEKVDFLDDLSGVIVTARKVLSDSGGQITIRRLNRREYENTIRDLLGVEIEAEELPDDANSGGFDTSGTALFFSSDQFEQYVKIARRALDEVIVTTGRPERKSAKRESEEGALKLTGNRYRNLVKSHERAEAWKKSGKPPTEFGFIDEARVEFEDGNYRMHGPTYKHFLKRPEMKTGALLYTSFAGAYLDVTGIPAKTPPGDYILRVRAGALEGVEPSRRFLEYGQLLDGAQSGELAVLGCVEVRGTIDNPEVIEIPIRVEKGGSRNIALRERQPNNRDAARYRYTLSKAKNDGVCTEANLWIDWTEWEGPVVEQWPPESHGLIFFKGKDAKLNETYAREIIERFAKRAFRVRKPTAAYLDKLMLLFRERRAAGEKFYEAIKEPLAVVLASPGFLYLREPGTDEGKRKLSEPELAVRLAYFLWSAPPDKELRKRAWSGELKKPGVLKGEIDRMLADPKAAEFVSGFAHQWLHMERLDFFQYNFRLYPEFDDSMKEAARSEVYQTIASILAENRSVGDLLKSDYVVINNLLASFYGISGVNGGEFRKVAVPDGLPRGGLLGMAGILAMGSDGERTSPVERGAWIMRKLLNNPPPPAPPNVPQLSRHGDKLLTARETLLLHQEEPQCAQCHRKIDPLGFGLENFNAVGLWRDVETVEGERVRRKPARSKVYPIDASGRLPNGKEFTGFFEMRDRMAGMEQAFARSYTEALIEYGLGRPFGFSDEDLAVTVMEKAVEQGYSMRAFIHALVESRHFRMK